jgi:hypothetical protein
MPSGSLPRTNSCASDNPAQVIEENPEEAVKYDSNRDSYQRNEYGTGEGAHELNIAQAA